MAVLLAQEVAVVAKLHNEVGRFNHRGRKEYRTIKHRAHTKNVT